MRGRRTSKRRILRVVLAYLLLAGCIAVAILGASREIYWLCVVGVIASALAVIYIFVTIKSGPVITSTNW